MRTESITLTAANGAELFVHLWLSDAAPKAAVQIDHGLAEHASRYARLAASLTCGGYAVYERDLRGPGRTARPW